MEIGILGGGIAGLSVALALRRQGYNPRVYERRAVPATMGAGVTLWPNASFVLEELGLLQDIEAIGGRPLTMRRQDAAGNALGGLDLGLLDRTMGYPTCTVLRRHLQDLMEDASNELASMARLVLQRAQQHWQELDEHLQWCDERIAAHKAADPQVQRAAQLLGVGPVTASALIASVGDFKQFKNGAQLGAWLGLTPKQNSSGGKARLGGITKRGDTYLRTLLIQGAKAVVLTGKGCTNNPIGQWAQRLRERVGWQKAIVALANKNARILWAVLTREAPFDAHHISVKPTAVAPL